MNGGMASCVASISRSEDAAGGLGALSCFWDLCQGMEDVVSHGGTGELSQRALTP